MQEIESLYAEKERKDIKQYCIKHGNTIRYRGQTFYLYLNRIYDEEMNLIISQAENGFLDLYEYHEYFEQPTI